MSFPRRWPWVLAGLAAVLAGCGGNQGDLAGSPAGPGALLAPGQDSEDNFTVLLYASADPLAHAQQAQYYLAQTEKHARWKGLFILSQEGGSQLCWGRYPTIEAAQKDLKTARSFKSPTGVRVYDTAIIIPLPVKEIGPPQWRLANAPGFYTVLVAVFYDVPEAKYVGRKNFALQYCKQLRDKGHEAYCYHDASRSGVTVGSFPQSSIQITNKGGQEEHRIVDSRMIATMKEFQFLAVNGRKELIKVPAGSRRDLTFDPELWGSSEEEARQTMKLAAQGWEVRYQRPYPVRIPHKGPSNDASPDGGPGYPQPR